MSDSIPGGTAREQYHDQRRRSVRWRSQRRERHGDQHHDRQRRGSVRRTRGGSGVASGTTINSGGGQYVGAFGGSGVAIDTTISSGGVQGVGDDVGGSGTAIGTTILLGGSEIIASTGIDSGAQISGGEQDLFGLASGVTVFTGSQVVESGGIASNTTVSSGGSLVVLSSGLADPAIIYSGGSETISAGGTDLGALVSGTQLD